MGVLPALPAERPDLRAVMTRAGVYVAKYQQNFSLLPADEHYVQALAAADDRKHWTDGVCRAGLT